MDDHVIESPKGPGFHFGRAINNTPFVDLWAWSPELEREIRRTGVARFSMTDWYDETHGLEFLEKFAEQIRELILRNHHVGVLSVVSRLRNLERLTLFASSTGVDLRVDDIDFAPLTRLQTCTIEHPNSISNVFACASLHELMIERGGLRDLNVLGPLEHLEHLDLRSAPVRSLSGVERMKSLRTLRFTEGPLESLDGIEQTRVETLWLAYLRRLKLVAPLTALSTLRLLDIVSCKKIIDLERIGEVTSLENLGINGQGAISSLSFVRGLVNLCEFRCGTTNILDGDLSVLLQLPKLERPVINPHRKHYSHTSDLLFRLIHDR